MPITKTDLLREFNTPFRFLFERDDNTFLRLFWFNYDRFKDEFYMGSSLNPIISAGKSDVRDVIFMEDKKFGIEIDDSLKKKKYNSLKFSYHSSGIRQLRMVDPILSTKDKVYHEQLYREKYSKLDSLNTSEMLFAMLTKRISIYQDYKKHVNSKNTSAVLLKTPLNYLNYRQVFEFYICQAPGQITSNFIIKNGTPYDDLTFKLKDNLYLYIKFVINTAENSLNSQYPEREILFFKDNDKLKSFTFK